MMESTGENVGMLATHATPAPLGEHRARIVEYLRAVALPADCVARTVVDQRFAGGDEGSFLRAGLLVWAGVACGADVDDLVPVAAALVLLDRFMQLHDELVDSPAGCDSEQDAARWGLGQTLNAGDALYAVALRALAGNVIDYGARLAAAALITRAVLEAIEIRTREVLEARRHPRAEPVHLLRGRGAVLTGAALEAGATIAGCVHVGPAFNLVGRLLEVTATNADARRRRSARLRAVSIVRQCAVAAAARGSFEQIARFVEG